MSRHRISTLLLFAAPIACIALCMPAWDPAVGQSPAVSSSKMQSLLKERRDVLSDRFNVCLLEFKSGTNTQETVIAARKDLLEAELALAIDKTARIAVLEQFVNNAKDHEKLILERHKTGSQGVSHTDVLMSKAQRLGTEIALLREQETNNQ